ncbi:MAG: hypothetical protein ACP5IZ_10000 [Thermoprotei archaeon]|jgi:hypothetical protein
MSSEKTKWEYEGKLDKRFIALVIVGVVVLTAFIISSWSSPSTVQEKTTSTTTTIVKTIFSIEYGSIMVPPSGIPMLTLSVKYNGEKVEYYTSIMLTITTDKGPIGNIKIYDGTLVPGNTYTWASWMDDSVNNQWLMNPPVFTPGKNYSVNVSIMLSNKTVYSVSSSIVAGVPPFVIADVLIYQTYRWHNASITVTVWNTGDKTIKTLFVTVMTDNIPITFGPLNVNIKPGERFTFVHNMTNVTFGYGKYAVTVRGILDDESSYTTAVKTTVKSSY